MAECTFYSTLAHTFQFAPKLTKDYFAAIFRTEQEMGRQTIACSILKMKCGSQRRCCGRDGWRRIHPPSGLCSEQNPFPVSCSSHYKHCCFAGLLHASSFPSQGTQRRTFSDTQTGHRTSANHSSIEVSGENIYITLQKKKKRRRKML